MHYEYMKHGIAENNIESLTKYFDKPITQYLPHM